jgi:hypothetical protein
MNTINRPTKWVLEFTPSLEDAQIFHLYHAHNSPTLRRQYLVGRIIITAVALIGFLLFFYFVTTTSPAAPNPPPAKIVYSFSLLALLLATFVFFYYPEGYKNKIFKDTEKLYNEGKEGFVPQKCTLSFDESEIHSVSEIGEGKIIWTSVDKIIVNEDYIYIYISAVNAIIIPKRAFSDDRQRNDFIDYIQRNHAIAL